MKFDNAVESTLPNIREYSLFDMLVSFDAVAEAVNLALTQIEISEEVRNYLVLMFVAHKLRKAKARSPKKKESFLARQICKRLENQCHRSAQYEWLFKTKEETCTKTPNEAKSEDLKLEIKNAETTQE